jgi:hypothetical protein
VEGEWDEKEGAEGRMRRAGKKRGRVGKGEGRRGEHTVQQINNKNTSVIFHQTFKMFPGSRFRRLYSSKKR